MNNKNSVLYRKEGYLIPTYKTIKEDGHDWVYEVGQDWFKLVKYRLHDGYQLYKVEATYAKGLKPSAYYVVAKTSRDAKKKFLSHFGWLKFVFNVSLLDGEIRDEILNTVNKYIVI